MNINDNPERLLKEEQKVLDKLISEMNKEIDSLDNSIKVLIEGINNADISINHDLYEDRLEARGRMIRDEEKRKKIRQARDSLYEYRLLLEYEEYDGKKDFQELKIGLHSYSPYIKKYVDPICKDFVLNNSSVNYKCNVVDDEGKYHSTYKLIAKNQIKLHFYRVKKAINLYPGIIDEETLEKMKKNNFFSDEYLNELIKEFDSDAFDSDIATQIIYDEFLQELLERRSNTEFENIVFSIQKKQSEIIQAPYPQSMIVQGCAGSGKSMIMLHRLPFILCDEPEKFKRNNLFIITPSQMYIQMVENMRYQLEISDINMGTIEQYYDYCIEKYAGHKAGEYGKINYSKKITPENEKYIYSEKCVSDIKEYFNRLCNFDYAKTSNAALLLEMEEKLDIDMLRPAQIISNRTLSIRKIIDKNKEALSTYHRSIYEIVDSLRKLSLNLQNKKREIEREITKKLSAEKELIVSNQKEIEKLDNEKNVTAINNRKNIIDLAKFNIEKYMSLLEEIKTDEEYFKKLLSLSTKVSTVIKPFETLKNVFSENEYSDIYSAIDNIGQLIGGYYALSWDFSKLTEKYIEYTSSANDELNFIQQLVFSLQNVNVKYLEYNEFQYIVKEEKTASELRNNAIRDAYAHIIEKSGIKLSSKNTAFQFSPYLYLQTIYQYQGAPNASSESLIAIDETQGIAPEEIRLLKNINGNNVVFNMYGDIYQHIEGTKGIESWDDYKEILEFKEYEMQENYRNASQITEYCNNVFGMKMNPINTPGSGVHEIKTEADLHSEIIRQLTNSKRVGLGAILVGNKYEADYLLDVFSDYEKKFHNMTSDTFSIHHTRWNIINIDDAKGLEFSSVIVLTGKMSRNEKYIAYTRALDELFVYQGDIDISSYQEKENKRDTGGYTPNEKQKELKQKDNRPKETYANSEVRNFFESKGLEVLDQRDNGGRLWVIGEKNAIREVVNEAISKFVISGKYLASKEIMNKSGWCTKTDK